MTRGEVALDEAINDYADVPSNVRQSILSKLRSDGFEITDRYNPSVLSQVRNIVDGTGQSPRRIIDELRALLSANI